MQAAASAAPRLRSRVRHGSGWTAIALDGVINEHSDFAPLTRQVTGDTVVIDTERVRRINSMGVREWVNWMKALRSGGHRVALIACSPAIMDQVNLVRNFAEGTIVVSFQAPYYCDRCDLEQEHLIQTSQLLASGARTAPPFPCGKPACALTFDDVEESYFSFLDDQSAVADAEALARVIASANAALSEEAAPALSAVAATAAAATPKAGAARAGDEPEVFADEPRSAAGDIAFLGVLVLLGSLLGVLIYLMLTLE